MVFEPGKGIKKRLKVALPEADLVCTTSSGRVVAEVMRSRPDVILIDVRLPDQDGFIICQQLAVHRETRHIPILYLTGSAVELEGFGPDADRIIAADDFDSLSQRVKAAVREGYIQRTIKETLATATAAPKGSAGLTENEVDVLSSGGFSAEAEMDLRPLTEAAAKYDALLAASLTVARAANKLGVTAGRVRQRLLAKPAELYGVRQGNVWRLPAFQFGPQGLVPNIERVIPRLDRELNPVAVDGWFRLPSVDLEQDGRNVSPLDWLAQGRTWEPVAELAEDL